MDIVWLQKDFGVYIVCQLFLLIDSSRSICLIADKPVVI